MKKAIFVRFLTLSAIVIIICSIISAVIFGFNAEKNTQDWLSKLALSVAQNYLISTDVNYLSELAGGSRVTIIAPDGQVLADSLADIAFMENHATREEVKNAKKGAVYIAKRESTTLDEQFMYASVKTQDGNTIRIAQKYTGILENLTFLLPASLAAVLAALILSIFISLDFSKSLTRPLEKIVDSLSIGEFENLYERRTDYYELDKIVLTLENLLKKINDSNLELASEREKVNWILSNMAEGFILCDADRTIVLCNNSAKKFFNAKDNVEKQNIMVLTRDARIRAAIDKALLQAGSTYFDMQTTDGRIVAAHISPVTNDYFAFEKGVTILLIDVTFNRQLQKERQEFFSNASHELKTPITSIRGFAEMLSKGMVKDGTKQQEIFMRIETEAQRMSELINDILMISKLESKKIREEYEQLSLNQVINEVVLSVQPKAQMSEVKINMNCEDVVFYASKRQMYDLASNLLENAVKYNKLGGSVDVSLKKSGNQIIFTVRDTGIGIPKASQSRIFERFYRVDRGRNKDIAGTGLGLSIVKHIVSNYEGTIELNSIPGEGTQVSIIFPLERTNKDSR
jgi:two-component system phosphate regulon sensor histidine kinase PhoR